jgi:hypothetical protein
LQVLQFMSVKNAIHLMKTECQKQKVRKKMILVFTLMFDQIYCEMRCLSPMDQHCSVKHKMQSHILLLRGFPLVTFVPFCQLVDFYAFYISISGTQ